MPSDPLDQWIAHRRSQTESFDLTKGVMDALAAPKSASPSERFCSWATNLGSSIPYPIPFAAAGCSGVLRVTIVLLILFIPN